MLEDSCASDCIWWHTLQAFRVAVAFLSPDYGSLVYGASAGKRRRNPSSGGDVVIDLTADEPEPCSSDLQRLRASLLLKVMLT